MKKRVYLSDRAAYKKWLKQQIKRIREQHNNVLVVGRLEYRREGIMTSNGSRWDFKWFEFPNAEGYLDM